MIDAPQITQTALQNTAIIHLTIPREEIQTVMGPGIGELMATIAAQGIKPTGSWFNHHLKMASDTWDFEISAPEECADINDAAFPIEGNRQVFRRIVRCSDGFPIFWKFLRNIS